MMLTSGILGSQLHLSRSIDRVSQYPTRTGQLLPGNKVSGLYSQMRNFRIACFEAGVAFRSMGAVNIIRGDLRSYTSIGSESFRM